MSIGAGELLLVDGIDISGDTTKFESGEASPATERTSILHTKRQRSSLKLLDDSFMLEAYWEPDTIQRIFNGGRAARLSHVYGLRAGAPMLTFPGVVSPKKSHMIPVGELQHWSSEGTINGPVREGGMIYRSPETVPDFAAGRQMLFEGAGAQYADIGTSAAERTIQLVAHVTGPFDALGTLSVYHAAAIAGPWTKIAAASDITLARLPGTPGTFNGAEHKGVISRYVGLDLVVSALTTVTLEAEDLGGGVHGYSSISGGVGAGSYTPGGRFYPATPSGLISLLSFETSDEVEIVVVNDADPLGEDLTGSALAAGDSQIARKRLESGGAFAAAGAEFVSRGADHTTLSTSTGAFDDYLIGGVTYRIAFRHGGGVADLTILSGQTNWEAVGLLTVEE